MKLEGEYGPSPTKWVRDQVEAYERSGGQEANTAGGTVGADETDLTHSGLQLGRRTGGPKSWR